MKQECTAVAKHLLDTSENSAAPKRRKISPQEKDAIFERLFRVAKEKLDITLSAKRASNGWSILVRERGIDFPYARIDDQKNLYPPKSRKFVTNLNDPNFVYFLRHNRVDEEGTEQAFQASINFHNEWVAEQEKRAKDAREIKADLIARITKIVSDARSSFDISSISLGEGHKYAEFIKFLDDLKQLGDNAVHQIHSK